MTTTQPESDDDGSAPAPRRPVRSRLIRSAVGLAVSVAVFLALLAVVQVRAGDSAATAMGQARRFTPPPAPSLTTEQPTRDLVVVVGDEWAAPQNTVANRPWTYLFQQDAGVRVRTFASDGGAYVSSAVAEGGATFDSTVAQIPSDASVVLFFGGARDAQDDPAELAAATTKALADASYRAPRARLVLVGPVPLEPSGAAGLTELRSVLRIAAGTARASWVDPVQQKWLTSSRDWAEDGTGPSAAGNRRLAQRMEETLAPFLSTTPAIAPSPSSG